MSHSRRKFIANTAKGLLLTPAVSFIGCSPSKQAASTSSAKDVPGQTRKRAV